MSIVSIVLFALQYFLGLFIICVLAKAIIERENKHQKSNRISREIISIAMRNVEDCKTDDLEDMIRYFEGLEEEVRYNIKG